MKFETSNSELIIPYLLIIGISVLSATYIIKHKKEKIEIYDSADQLRELADALEDFPFNETKNILWELGSEKSKDNFAFYFKYEFSLLKYTSDCIVRIRLNNNKNSLSEFNIQCYPTELNKLGRLFREFSKLEKKTLTWYGFNGEVM